LNTDGLCNNVSSFLLFVSRINSDYVIDKLLFSLKEIKATFELCDPDAHLPMFSQ